jgi:uncharacterized protein (TIGR03382 family)
MMKLAWLAVAAIGCGGVPDPEAPVVQRPNFAGDTRPAAPVPIRRALGGGAAQVLYLNFDGVALTQAFNDNAPGNQSQIAGTTVPAFAPPPGAKFTRQQGIDAITDRLRGYYHPFNVQVTTTRPTSGDYTMIAVGGGHAIAGEPQGVGGVSPLDCTNANLDNVVFDFSDDQTPDFGGLPQIAITAAHESGHSFGLEHTDNPLDIMYSVAMPSTTIQNLFVAKFTTGNYSSFNAGGSETGPSCGRANPLDNAAILNTTVGANPNPGDLQAPSLSFTYPIVPQVNPSFPVRFTATDDTKVVRLELYKNAELIAVLTTPPYQANLSVASGEIFDLTVDAIDPNANRATLTRGFTADSVNPTGCPDNTCSGGLTCKDGLCKKAIGDTCTNAIQCTTNLCKKPVGTTASICTVTCTAAKPCPMGYACGSDSLCAVSMAPTTKMNGEACTMPSDCTSGRCQDVCVAACDDSTSCAPGELCIVVGGGTGCVPGPSPMPKSSGGCSAAPGRPSLPLVVLLFAAPLLRRRRVN